MKRRADAESQDLPRNLPPSESGLEEERFGKFLKTENRSRSVSPEPSMDNWLDKVKFVEFLGCGTFGMVMKAISGSETSSTVEELEDATATAVKYIGLTNSKTEDRQEFIKGFKNLNNKFHRNVVKNWRMVEGRFTTPELHMLFKTNSEDGVKYSTEGRKLMYEFFGQTLIEGGMDGILMQIQLCGETLRKWIVNENFEVTLDLDPDWTWIKGVSNVLVKGIKISEGIIAGIKFLHDNGIVHGNLKPENVLFTHTNYQLPIKIGDYGLPRNYSEDGILLFGGDTYDYIDPSLESYDDTLIGRKQADLFSLGFMLMELFQNKMPEERSYIFHKVVYLQELELVENHPIITNLKEIILKLICRKMSPEDIIELEFNISITTLLKRGNTMTGPELEFLILQFTSMCKDSAIHSKIAAAFSKITSYSEFEGALHAMAILGFSGGNWVNEATLTAMIDTDESKKMWKAFDEVGFIEKLNNFTISPAGLFQPLTSIYLKSGEFFRIFGKVCKVESNMQGLNGWILGKAKGKEHDDRARECFKTAWPFAVNNEDVKYLRKFKGLSGFTFFLEMSSQEQTYEKFKTIIGLEDKDTLVVGKNLSGKFRSHGKFQEGITLCRELLPVSEGMLGNVHAVTLGIAETLALCLQDHGLHAEGVRVRKLIVGSCENAYGVGDKRTLKRKIELAEAYTEAGKAKAREIYEHILSACETASDDDDCDELSQLVQDELKRC